MIIKCTYANGDEVITRFNGTLEEARIYYLNKLFNIGITSDNLQKCIDIKEVTTMVKGGINCFGCDLDYTEGYWLEIEGEEEIFFCEECAEKAGLIGKPGVYEHTEEEEEEEEVTWTEIMNKAWHLAVNSGTFTDDPKEEAGDVYLVKDIRLVVDAFAKDIEEGKLNDYEDPASFLDAHGIEWE